MKNARSLLLLITMLLPACSDRSGPTAPDNAGLGVPFKLRVGETTQIVREPVGLRFDRITYDNRCPVDVQCIHGGAAVAELTVDVLGAKSTFELVYQRKVSGYTFTLRQVEPDRFSRGRPIDPRRYVVELLVTRDEVAIY